MSSSKSLASSMSSSPSPRDIEKIGVARTPRDMAAVESRDIEHCVTVPHLAVTLHDRHRQGLAQWRSCKESLHFRCTRRMYVAAMLALWGVADLMVLLLGVAVCDFPQRRVGGNLLYKRQGGMHRRHCQRSKGLYSAVWECGTCPSFAFFF